MNGGRFTSPNDGDDYDYFKRDIKISAWLVGIAWGAALLVYLYYKFF